MKLRVDIPEDHKLLNLAPRVEGRGKYIGDYGWAFAITSDARILVLWDDGGIDRIESEEGILMWGNK